MILRDPGLETRNIMFGILNALMPRILGNSGF
jgi:hypothetical protein